MKTFIAALLIATFTNVTASAQNAPLAPCRQAYVFFDLGGTLVDTDSHNFNPMFYIKGALPYLKQLHKNGHKLGLLVDIPESWGRDFPQFSLIKDLPTAKWKRTLAFIRGEISEDQASWSGPEFEPRFFGNFQGSGSDEKFFGNVFLPQTNAERKSTGNNIIFVRGRAAADKDGCDAVFMGEDLMQMKLAEDAGMIPYAVGQPQRPFFLPAQQIQQYIADFKKQKELKYSIDMARARSGNRALGRSRSRDSAARPLQ